MRLIVMVALCSLLLPDARADFTWIWPAEYRSNYDGDSIRLDAHLGREVWIVNGDFRLDGCDTQEVKGGTEQTKKAAQLAKARVEEILTGATSIEVTYWGEDGKYGRALVAVSADGKDLCDTLMAEHLAVPYHGQAKSELAPLWDEALKALGLAE